MPENARRTFLKTVGLTVGAVGLAGANSRITADSVQKPVE